MKERRESREAAVQFLFQSDLNPDANSEQNAEFWDLRAARSTSQKVRSFANELIQGVFANREVIDAEIQKCVANYEIHRLAAVDRNILRIAIYEMLFCDETPPVVAINEAIEIAKRFGGKDSGRFVNGILDRIRSGLSRPSREPREPSAKANKPETPSS